MRRFYFTLDDGSAAGMDDYIGNIRGARREARAEAIRTGKTIYINDLRNDDIVDYVTPE